MIVKQNTYPCLETVFRFYVFEYLFVKYRDIVSILGIQLEYVIMHYFDIGHHLITLLAVAVDFTFQISTSQLVSIFDLAFSQYLLVF